MEYSENNNAINNNQNLQCKNCGNIIQVGDIFCSSCGARNYDNTMSGLGNNINGAIYNQNNLSTSDVNYNINTNPLGNVDNNLNDKLNKNAIYSIVGGLISIFIFWWLSLCGIGCGITALKEIKVKGGKGKSLAILGIIISSLSLVLFVIFSAISNFLIINLL